MGSKQTQASTKQSFNFQDEFDGSLERPWKSNSLEASSTGCRAKCSAPVTGPDLIDQSPVVSGNLSEYRIGDLVRSYNSSTVAHDSAGVPAIPIPIPHIRTPDSDSMITDYSDRMADHNSWAPDLFQSSWNPHRLVSQASRTERPVKINMCGGVENSRPHSDLLDTCSLLTARNYSIRDSPTHPERLSRLRPQSYDSQSSQENDLGDLGLNLNCAQQLGNRHTCHQLDTESPTKKCPNVTISPWGWANMCRDTNTEVVGQSYPHGTTINELETRMNLTQLPQMYPEMTNENTEIGERSYSSHANTRLWLKTEPYNVQETTNLTAQRNATHSQPVSHFSSADGNYQCVTTIGPDTINTPDQTRQISHGDSGESKHSPSSAYLQQLTFSPSEKWYHSLGLLSAFTQILAPSHCNHPAEVDKESISRVQEYETICDRSDAEPPKSTCTPVPRAQTHHPCLSTGPISTESNLWTVPDRLEHAYCHHDSVPFPSTEFDPDPCTTHPCLFGTLSESTLDELKQFACKFKQRRMKLGVTQAEVGRALGRMQLGQFGCLSQSTICRFESLTLSHNNMLVLKPILEKWLEQMEAQARASPSSLPGSPTDAIEPRDGSMDPERRRRRTSITEPEKRMLEAYFQVEPKPTSEELGRIANGIRLRKSVVRVWFCNQRQKQKRMQMKHHMSRDTQVCHPTTPTASNMHCYND
ncbi:unnamed protein product [Echinostoma caproni]|uniref:POU domain protein n=1 Tax=Echinostoma caproni TaxID=27848 RepID=A0A183ASZ8_9TREM|nr:unnamed protein product [Echinostoma caproni]